MLKDIVINPFLWTLAVTLMLINTNVNAFHENLGIDDNKAAELYNSNPNDPAISR